MRPRPGGRGELVITDNQRTVTTASMRPRPGGRGERASIASPTDGMTASMRPRPGGRGEVSDGGDMAASSWASMRPRPGGRGEPGQVRQVAAATQPSMRPRPGGHGERLRLHRLQRVGFRPSMRPRPGGRGERSSAVSDERLPISLQCGHDPEAVESTDLLKVLIPDASFNAATTRRPWRAAPRPRRRVGPIPSMRPRPGGRGEQRRHDESARRRRSFNAATTRRPWRACRRSSTTRPVVVLQCGHDPEAVESIESTRPRPPPPRLQCGHDPEAVESNYIRSHRASRARFNAATTRRPWRASILKGGVMPGKPLQCGHDPEAVESPFAITPI